MNPPSRTATVARWPFACVMLIVMITGVHAEPDNDALFNLCPRDERMRLVVEEFDKDGSKAGLTEEQVRNAAESRLRGAGLYDSDVAPYLYVNVNAGPPKTGNRHFPFFSISVKYKRLLYDPWQPWLAFATTWVTGSAGQGDSSFILSSLSQHLDEFLVEYLRVRDSKACQELRAKDKG